MRNCNLTPPSTHRSWRLVPLALAALLVLAPAVQAQEQGARIEQQMSAEQFMAAGLDRLDPEQLANLNAWLNRAIDARTDLAVASAKQQVKEESRGLMNFGGSEPITGRISGEFRGFAKGRSYTLDNGQVWQQTDDATLVGARLTNPDVKMTPSLVGNVWYMQVGKYNTRAKVYRTK